MLLLSRPCCTLACIDVVLTTWLGCTQSYTVSTIWTVLSSTMNFLLDIALLCIVMPLHVSCMHHPSVSLLATLVWHFWNWFCRVSALPCAFFETALITEMCSALHLLAMYTVYLLLALDVGCTSVYLNALLICSLEPLETWCAHPFSYWFDLVEFAVDFDLNLNWLVHFLHCWLVIWLSWMLACPF